MTSLDTRGLRVDSRNEQQGRTQGVLAMGEDIQPHCNVVLEDWDPEIAAAILADPSPDALRVGIHALADLLASTVERPDEVRLVITPDLGQAVMRREPDRDASSPFDLRRGSGIVVGKTMRHGGGIDVLIDGTPLVEFDARDFRRTAAGGPRLSPGGVQLRRPTLVHEAQHANMQLNGSGSNNYGLEQTWTRARRYRFLIASKMCDEHRAQWNAAQVVGADLPTAEVVLDTLSQMGQLLATAVTHYQQSNRGPNDVGRLAIDVYRACIPFWTDVAYWTAEYREGDDIRELPEAVTQSAVWQRYVGPTWQPLAGALSQVPVAIASPPEALHESANRVATAVAESLQHIGFRDYVSPTLTELFDIDRYDFP